jgi:hypothetical protein
MTSPLSAERAIEILEGEWHTGDSVQALIVLRRVVKDYSSLRAENERLRLMFDNTEKARFELRIKLDKAEAELAAAQMTNAKNGAVIIEQMVELERARPLLEAARKYGDPRTRSADDLITAAYFYSKQSSGNEGSDHD